MEEICNLQNNQEKKQDQKKKKTKQPINKEAKKVFILFVLLF